MNAPRFAAIALIVGVAACQGSGNAATTPPLQTAAPSASATSPIPVPTGFKALKDGALPPGDYAAVSFAIPFTVTIPAPSGQEAWGAASAKLGSILALAPGEGVAISFMAPTGVHDPTNAAPLPLPADLVAWLTSHASLDITDRGQIPVGGVSATWLDAKIHGVPPYTGCGPGGNVGVPLVTTADQPEASLGAWYTSLAVCDQYPKRLYVLTVHGQLLLVGIDSGILSDAEPVLTSVKFFR